MVVNGYICNMAKFWRFRIQIGCIIFLASGAFGDLFGQSEMQSLRICEVNKSINMKTLPIPLHSNVKDISELSVCIPIQNVRIDIASAKIGKVKNARLILDVRSTHLQRVSIGMDGAKGFKRLMKEINQEAGRPSKLVQDDGKLAYYWDIGSKLPCNVLLTYDPRTEFSEAVLSK
jgi:hypothetical protein